MIMGWTNRKKRKGKMRKKKEKIKIIIGDMTKVRLVNGLDKGEEEEMGKKD